MSHPSKISRAFILGAGLGTRLRPLTENLPKPLVPVWNAPLITYAFDHLIAETGVSRFLINTHHAAEKYGEAFPGQVYRDCPLELRHEPQLLDTAGGLDNIRNWIPADESFFVYNGDILTDLPLAPAVEAHISSGDLVTLILRSGGQNANVAWDPETRRITDMRNALGTNATELFQFTGIYLVSPEFLSFLTPGKIESVVIPFLRAIEDGQRIGGVVVDEGHWSDLGDPESYLSALDLLSGGSFPSFGLTPEKTRIHPDATIASSAKVDNLSSVGAGAVVGENARVSRSVVWERAVVPDGERVAGEVVLPTGR